MNTPTYEQQWQKITEAYMRDEIKPFNEGFCFCGTLCNGSKEWSLYTNEGAVHRSVFGYKAHEFLAMEDALLRVIYIKCNTISLRCYFIGNPPSKHPNYEQAVYEGMVAALEVLRQIHIERGDETAINWGTPLTKRTLQTA